jgi:hypothetical protein
VSLSTFAPAQNTGSSQAASLLSQALAALGNTSQVVDLTASGTAVWIHGAQESGNVTFRMKGLAESRLFGIAWENT